MVSKGRLAERERTMPGESGLRLFVEGGARGELAQRARRAFGRLFERAGVVRRPRVVACGGRPATFDKFREHLERGQGPALLLVDAEDPAPVPRDPWAHVRRRAGDGWSRPATATDDDLFFMAVVMETWLLVSEDVRFRSRQRLEQVAKGSIYALLRKAVPGWSEHQKAQSFDLLEEAAPALLTQHCPEFKLLIDRLNRG